MTLKWTIAPAINRGIRTIHFTDTGTPKLIADVLWQKEPDLKDLAQLPNHAHGGHPLSESEDMTSIVAPLETVEGPWALMSILSAERQRADDVVRFGIISVEGQVVVVCVTIPKQENAEHRHEKLRAFDSLTEAMDVCEDWQPAAVGDICDCGPVK